MCTIKHNNKNNNNNHKNYNQYDNYAIKFITNVSTKRLLFLLKILVLFLMIA